MKRPELRDELLARVDADWHQAERLFEVVDSDSQLSAELDALLASPATPLLAVLPGWDACPNEGARLVEIVGDNARWLARVVDEHGWPGLSLVGADGTDAAWLVAQHADADNDLRRPWIGPLEEAVRTSEADPRHLASLVDRIAVVDGVPQTYGTVAVLEEGEVVFPHPVFDPPELESRRAAIGLPSIAEDTALLEQGEIIPFGPDRQDHPLVRWPVEQA